MTEEEKDLEKQFYLYQQLVTMHPDAFVLEVYIGPEMHKYHCKRRDSFVAVCDRDGAFRRLILNVSLN
jgi:hypothetical protein